MFSFFCARGKVGCLEEKKKDDSILVTNNKGQSKGD